jgi:PAS domain S-box-containing protein
MEMGMQNVANGSQIAHAAAAAGRIFWISQDASSLQLTRVDSELCERLGYSCADLLGLSLAHISIPADRHRELTAYVNALKARRATYEFSMRCLKANGEIATLEVAATIMKRAPSEKPRVVAMVRAR